MRLGRGGAVIAIFVASIAFSAAALGGAYLHFMNFEPSASRYPVRGIDVSHHQGAIAWETLKGRGVHFVYMKASEGGDHVDTRFADNWTAAARAGLARGAYHYFTLCRPGIVQAHNFMRTVALDKTAMPPAVDLEFGGNCKHRPTRAEFLRELKAFLTTIERRYGKRPILYVTRSFHARYLTGELNDYGYWIRSIYFRPTVPGRRWLIWQFHHRGRRDGIKGAVDLNVFRGNRAAFERWRRTGQWRRETPSPGPIPGSGPGKASGGNG